MHTADQIAHPAAAYAAHDLSELLPAVETSCEVLADMVDASVQMGRHSEGVRALRCIASMAQAIDSPFVYGIHARCAALLADDACSETLFQKALTLFSHADAELELGKTHLFYGEWLRRQRRRADAVEQLTMARDVLGVDLGELQMRATRELKICTDRRSARYGCKLTVQESVVAARAAAGATNTEIARELHLSPHTVDYHLRKVYQKLQVVGRRELRHRLTETQAGRT